MDKKELNINSNTADILAIGAHPDDVELGCSGTLIKEIQNGKRIGLLDLTKGELGTRGTSKVRKKEATIAATEIGASFRDQLHLKDGFISNDINSQLLLIKKIRTYKPKIVICNAPKDRHPDHGNSSKLVISACFLSGLEKINTNQTVWRPNHVYHYIQWLPIEPDFLVDISDFMNAKIKSILAYKSQFYGENNTGRQTPISTKNFFDSITYRSRDFGRLIGVEYAEGFIASRKIAVNNISDLI